MEGDENGCGEVDVTRKGEGDQTVRMTKGIGRAVERKKRKNAASRTSVVEVCTYGMLVYHNERLTEVVKT